MEQGQFVPDNSHLRLHKGGNEVFLQCLLKKNMKLPLSDYGLHFVLNAVQEDSCPNQTDSRQQDKSLVGFLNLGVFTCRGHSIQGTEEHKGVYRAVKMRSQN